MHWKRVTSELHDSYFCLMKIKHSILKIEWAIEWMIELLYNSVKTGSQQAGDQMSWGPEKSETRCGRDSHHPAEGALRTPKGELEIRELEIRELETRCSRENHHPAEGALGTPDGVWGPDQLVIIWGRESQQKAEPPGLWLSSTGEQERHNADGHKSGGQYVAVFVQSPTPSHSKTLSNPFRTLTIK